MKCIMLVLLILLIPAVCWADTKEIITEYTYVAGKNETIAGAEDKALLYAQRQAIEQAGTWIGGYGVIRDKQLDPDEIRAIAAGLLSVDIIGRYISPTSVTIKIKALVETSQLTQVVNNRQLIYENKVLQNDNERLLKQIDELKLKTAKANEIAENERLLRANLFFYEGKKYASLNDHEAAIIYFNRAIELNPDFVYALHNRGRSLSFRGQFSEALKDFNNVLAYNSDDTNALYGKAYCLARVGKLNDALETIEKYLALASSSNRDSFEIIQLATKLHERLIKDSK